MTQNPNTDSNRQPKTLQLKIGAGMIGSIGTIGVLWWLWQREKKRTKILRNEIQQLQANLTNEKKRSTDL